MPTLTLTDAEHASVVDALHSDARRLDDFACSVSRDGGHYKQLAKNARALARKIEKSAPDAPKNGFTRGGYSFRPGDYDTHGVRVWHVRPTFDRNHLAATISAASGSAGWIISLPGHAPVSQRRPAHHAIP